MRSAYPICFWHAFKRGLSVLGRMGPALVSTMMKKSRKAFAIFLVMKQAAQPGQRRVLRRGDAKRLR